MTQNNNPPPRDPWVAFHESLFGPAAAMRVHVDPDGTLFTDLISAEDFYSEELTPTDDAEVTRQLRSLGRILDPVSTEQRQQLDTIAAMRPAKKRRKKKSERRKK